MIRSDCSQFLSSTLAPQEIEVVRLCFGLDSGKALSVEEAASRLEKPVSVVSKLLAEGLEELRAAYTERYFEPGDEFDEVEDSV